MTLKAKVNDPRMQDQLRKSQDAYIVFGANLVILAQICDELSSGQVKFPKLLSQNGQYDLEDQVPWPSFSIPDKSIPRCMFGANLVIPAQICDELLHGQGEFPRILNESGQNDLEGQGQWPQFSIPAESIPGCMFGANLVIPAQICDKLSCGQGKVHGRTDGRTDRWRQRQYPFGLKGHGVKRIIPSWHHKAPRMPKAFPMHACIGKAFCILGPLWGESSSRVLMFCCCC